MTEPVAGNPFFLRISLTDIVLRVNRLPEIRRFYREFLGLRTITDTPTRVEFSVTGRAPALVVLEDEPAAPEAPAGSAGLFHAAFLYPSRVALAAAVRRLLARNYPLQGAADHGVSEAIYLADPAGNGLELYADRPSAAWPRHGEGVAMMSDPLDLSALLAVGPGTAVDGDAPPDLRIGHVHLRGANLAAAESFYAGALGFPVRQRSYRGALFFGRDGYHHHLAVNTWQSFRPAPPRALGLARFTLRLSEPSEYARTLAALRALGAVESDTSAGARTRDPGGLEIALADPAAA